MTAVVAVSVRDQPCSDSTIPRFGHSANRAVPGSRHTEIELQLELEKLQRPLLRVGYFPGLFWRYRFESPHPGQV